MSAPKAKLELSLDEIIKNNKKDQKPGKRNVRRSAGNPKTLMKRNVSKAVKGVLKRKSIGGQKRRGVLNRANKGGSNNRDSGSAGNKTATQRLVNKLVKNALKRVTGGRPSRVGVARKVVRTGRGGIRGRGQTRNIALNRVSQRSRVIGRRPRIVNQLPAVTSANRRGRGNARRRGNRIVQVARREPNPIRAQLNFLRRQQQQSSRAPVVQQQPRRSAPIIRQQQRRPAPVQQRPQVIYVQQQRPAPVRRQPQQVIYVQQQPRRNFSRGRGRPQRRNDPFFEPPNFLQRVPASNNQFFGRGRGGRFLDRF